MNADALIGTVLGTSTLQQLIGQGGMGAVYLAQQSRPRRQVAVKILMPATALKPHQLSAFLERFRRETDAAASLEHTNIMPVYEYGERGGLAFLVMPYISGGTLRDVMERDNQMSFVDALNYLEQMAAALDFAHARGVIHRDIKPANMLLTPDGRLLLTDFGLVKLTDNQSEQIRLTGAGAPVGTPDYMSPEQVIGGDVDGRADQYSLGVVLFQMLTGVTPFQGETPMQIASQQLHMQPPLPRSFRPDLPELAEQVILKAMAKRPDDRFNNAMEFAAAFYASLNPSQMQTNIGQNRGGGLLTNAGVRKNSLFDPRWQNTGSVPAFGATQFNAPAQPMAAPTTSLSTDTGSSRAIPRPEGGLLSRTGLFPRIGDNTGKMPATRAAESELGGSSFFSTGQIPTTTGAQPAMFGQPNGLFGQSTLMNTQQDVQPQPTGFESSLFSQSTGTFAQQFPPNNIQQLSPANTIQQLSPIQSATTSLTLLNNEQKAGNTIKLTGPVKVVQVPVAPGQYVTGLLPVQKELPESHPEEQEKPLSPRRKIILLCAVVLILVSGLGSAFVLARSHSNKTPASTPISSTTQPNPSAAALAQATASAVANLVFYDPLTQNIHGFPTGTKDNKQYTFANGAYDITNNSGDAAAVVFQEGFTQTTMGYQITEEELKGQDTSPNNTFGMILRYNAKAVKNTTVDTFYSFEILNDSGSSQYRFYKYDGSKSQDAQWSQVWSANTGKEFHGGHGANAVNTIKVFADGSSFTFYINGKKVGTKTDSTYKSGSMGMLVNWKGTEVAYSNMLMTKN